MKSSKRSPLVSYLALALALCLAVPNAASATVGAYLSLPSLVAMSELIVSGTVVAQETEWSADHRLIYTHTTVSVAHYYKGSGPTLVTVATVGGRVGPREMHAAGTPRFTVGEDVMLFLHPSGDLFFPAALGQGVYHIQSGPSGPSATRDLSGLTLVRSDGTVAPSTEAALDVPSLEALVTRLVGGGS